MAKSYSPEQIESGWLKDWIRAFGALCGANGLQVRAWMKEYEELKGQSLFPYVFRETPMYHVALGLVHGLLAGRVPPSNMKAVIRDLEYTIYGGDYLGPSKEGFDWNAAKERVNRFLTIYDVSLADLNGDTPHFWTGRKRSRRKNKRGRGEGDTERSHHRGKKEKRGKQGS